MGASPSDIGSWASQRILDEFVEGGGLGMNRVNP